MKRRRLSLLAERDSFILLCIIRRKASVSRKSEHMRMTSIRGIERLITLPADIYWVQSLWTLDDDTFVRNTLREKVSLKSSHMLQSGVHGNFAVDDKTRETMKYPILCKRDSMNPSYESKVVSMTLWRGTVSTTESLCVIICRDLNSE